MTDGNQDETTPVLAWMARLGDQRLDLPQMRRAAVSDYIRVRGQIINALVGSIGNCTCHPAYYERDLIDPDCIYHFVDVPALVDELTQICTHFPPPGE